MKLHELFEAIKKASNQDLPEDKWKKSKYWPKSYDDDLDPAKIAFRKMLEDAVKKFHDPVENVLYNKGVNSHGGNTVFDNDHDFLEAFEEAQADGWIYDYTLEELKKKIEDTATRFDELAASIKSKIKLIRKPILMCATDPKGKALARAIREQDPIEEVYSKYVAYTKTAKILSVEVKQDGFEHDTLNFEFIPDLDLDTFHVEVDKKLISNNDFGFYTEVSDQEFEELFIKNAIGKIAKYYSLFDLLLGDMKFKPKYSPCEPMSKEEFEGFY